MLVTIHTYFGLNVAFRTANERSLREIMILQRRYTHRISMKERQARINFVREKHINQLLSHIHKQHVARPSFSDPSRAILFKRDRLKVNGILLASELYKSELPFINEFDTAFDTFWSLDIQLRLLKRLLKQFRRLFGANCLTDENLKLTPEGWKEIVALIRYGKAFYTLPLNKQMIVRHSDNRRWVRLFYHSVPFKIIVDRFKSIIDLKAYLKAQAGGVIFVPSMLMGGKNSVMECINSILKRIPSFDGHALGERKLTARQIARLKNRRHKYKMIFLWHFMHKGPVIKKELSLLSDLKICWAFSFSEMFVYVPKAHHIESAPNNGELSMSKSRPKIKFSAPLDIKRWPLLSVDNVLHLDVEDLVVQLQYNHVELNAFPELEKWKLNRFLKHYFGPSMDEIVKDKAATADIFFKGNQLMVSDPRMFLLSLLSDNIHFVPKS